MTPILTATLTTALFAATGGTLGQPNQRVYLDGGLVNCNKREARFYVEPSGMDGSTYVGRIYTMQGELRAEGHYADANLQIEHGRFTFYYPNGKVESTGLYEMGHKSGVWARYDEWGGALAEKVYDPEPLKDILYTQAQTMPQYPGGQKELVTYLRSKAVGNDAINAHGTVTASFTVERDGRVSDVKVLEGATGEIDQRVVDALKSSPPWTPGQQDGLPVRVKMRVPVPY